MKFIKFFLIKLIFLSGSWIWACNIDTASSNNVLRNCFHSELYHWADWSRTKPQFSDIIPPVGRFQDARLFFLKSAYILDFPVRDLNLSKKINLSTVRALDPQSTHKELKIDKSLLNDNDSGDYFKYVSQFSVTTTLKQPAEVQNRINLAFDVMITLERLAADQPRELAFDGHYYFVEDRSEIRDWMSVIVELDSRLSGMSPPDQILVQYMDNFSFLGLRGMAVTLFFERGNKTNVLQYFAVSLKGRLLKVPGAEDFLMGNKTVSSEAIRNVYFRGYKSGVIGGLPIYFQEKVDGMRSGMEKMKRDLK